MALAIVPRPSLPVIANAIFANHFSGVSGHNRRAQELSAALARVYFHETFGLAIGNRAVHFAHPLDETVQGNASFARLAFGQMIKSARMSRVPIAFPLDFSVSRIKTVVNYSR